MTRDSSADRVDRTNIEFATIDPAASTDLDQAFAIERAGHDLVLHYAIADVGFFVRPGDPLDNEAWQRGVTVYLPGHRAPLYPPALSEGAASLLPDGPRPAVVFTVRVDPEGGVVLDGCERALVHSRAKLAYDTVTANDLPDGFAELSQRIAAAEVARGAPRVDFPEQELERDGDGWELSFRPRLSSEDDNAAMSLATNMAVADVLFAAHTGLFRVMPEPDERQLERLRHSARALGLDWPNGVGLDEFERSLRPRRPTCRGVPHRRAAGERRRIVRDLSRRREAVARCHAGHLCPCDRTLAPPRRSVRDRGGARRHQRATGARLGDRILRPSAEGDVERRESWPIAPSAPPSSSPKR